TRGESALRSHDRLGCGAELAHVRGGRNVFGEIKIMYAVLRGHIGHGGVEKVRKRRYHSVELADLFRKERRITYVSRYDRKWKGEIIMRGLFVNTHDFKLTIQQYADKATYFA